MHLFKLQAVADGKKTVGDEDIIALMGDEASQTDNAWDLMDLQVSYIFSKNASLQNITLSCKPVFLSLLAS